MDKPVLIQSLLSLLQEHWSIRPSKIGALDGGMNSLTVRIEDAGELSVAKWVPDGQHEALLQGAEVALRLAQKAVRTAEPMLTRTGELVVNALGGGLVLMRWVPGLPLDGVSPADQHLMAAVLSRIHAALPQHYPPGGQPFFEWMATPVALAEHPWLVSAVKEVRCDYAALPALSCPMLEQTIDHCAR